MKLTVIGGGGVRSMFLAKSIALRAAALDIQELVLMDSDAQKLRIFGGMAKHLAEMLEPSLQITLTLDPIVAIRDADYVITTIRVGGDEARCRDEHEALSLGVLGQETTGAAGFSFAMRSIPVLTDYCELVKKYAKPGACVFNFTNPVGIVSQALRDAGYDFTYGICDAPTSMLAQLSALYGLPSDAFQGEIYGLNHLSWFSEILYNGKNIMPKLLANERARKETDLHFFDTSLLNHISCVPNEYCYYYYYREKAVENILRGGQTRGDDILEINREMMKELSSLDPEKDFDRCLSVYSKWYGEREARYMARETGIKRTAAWRFDPYAPDSGGYAGVALRFMEIIQSGQKGQMILCLPNQGALDFLEDTDTVEVTCDVEKGKVLPHHYGKVDRSQAECIRRVKYYERIGAQAILKRDRMLAAESLMAHPLVNSWSLAIQLTDAYIRENTVYTGVWR